jgi:hypothetical protein
MSVTKVLEILNDGGGRNDSGTKAQRKFHVYLDSVTTPEQEIYSHDSVPNFNSQHNVDTSLYATDIKISNVEWLIRLVVVNYATGTAPGVGGSGTDGTTVDPVSYNPIVHRTFQDIRRYADRCYGDGLLSAGGPTLNAGAVEGLPSILVSNSAGEPFKTPPMVEDSQEIINVVINQRLKSLDTILRYNNTINDSDITIGGRILKPYWGRMKVYPSVAKYDTEGVKYYTVTYKIVINEKTHNAYLVDQGFSYLDGGKLKRFTEGDVNDTLTGEDAAKFRDDATKLDGAGAFFGTGEGAEYVGFMTYYPKDWKPLKLPARDDIV